MRPRFKICCIQNSTEAWMAIDAGASALGLVSEMPSGPGVISEALIREIAEITPPGVSTFLLTSKQSVEEIMQQHCRCRTNTIQICDRLLQGSYEELKKKLPGIGIVQVIHVVNDGAIEEAQNIAPRVHALLLDSGNQDKSIKELGGTGRRHNWTISRRICETVQVPVFLAGGLNPDNITEAIKTVAPFGIDICSGIRTSGFLDPEKLRRFVREIESGNLAGPPL